MTANDICTITRADPGILERGAYPPCERRRRGKNEKVSLRQRCAKNENPSAK